MVALKRQEFVSDNSGHCKAKVRVPARWDSGETAASLYPHIQRGRGSSLGSLYKGTSLVLRAPHS